MSTLTSIDMQENLNIVTNDLSQQENPIDDEWSFTNCRWILYQERQEDLELLARKFRRLT